jgi:TLD
MKLMVAGFVQEYFPSSTFNLIYDASTHGWDASDFHNYCDDKGPTLTLLETVENFIFGGFSVQSWNQRYGYNPDSKAFIFSVNLCEKYPITASNQQAIECLGDVAAVFGTNEIVVASNANKNNES